MTMITAFTPRCRTPVRSSAAGLSPAPRAFSCHEARARRRRRIDLIARSIAGVLLLAGVIALVIPLTRIMAQVVLAHEVTP